MSDRDSASHLLESDNASAETAPKCLDRRRFLGQAGAAATIAAGALAAPSAAFAQSGSRSPGLEHISPPAGVTNNRVMQSFVNRVTAATEEALIPVPPHTTNGDETRYPDKSGTYSKGLLQDGPGRVNLNAFQSLKTAMASGRPSDFERIIIGGTRTLNGPQGALAYGLEGTDAVQFGNATSPANQESIVIVPPPPAVAGAAYGTELVEMYWGSLLRDVAFTDYPGNSLAALAAAELSGMPSYAGPRNGSGHVTPNLLFRGPFPGETIGPYMSQLFITPTSIGQQAMSQQMTTYLPNIDYMTDLTTWEEVQNGIDTGLRNQVDSQDRYLHDGRGLAAFTHIDVLYQEYLTALMVLGTIGAPVNPGNPYVHSRTQNGFSTFGGPDFAASIGEVAARALDVVWWQKWVVHLRHRPESGGGIVHLMQTGQGGTIDAHVNSNVLNSQAVQQSFSKYGSYLLSQAFPEGSPTHPAYPTGHGTVGGACITMLKFFYDGSFVIPNPQVPTSDGLSLVPYTGSDAGQITVNGELNKLGHNVSFGHGIHAGIHWRSDTDSSLILGEALAISVLQDRAQTYNEKFTVHFTKFDGTIATISNQ
ncbi:MAG: vanadium-dependent haloperoxidase [Candidatus Korobacteraceae bacterium]